MKCTLNWGNPDKTILLIQLDKGWDWVDFYSSLDDYLMFMNSVDHRVHLIIYSTENPLRMPPNALVNMPSLMRFTHPREGTTVVVGQVPFLRPLMEILKKTIGLRYLVENYLYADSVDEAFAALAEKTLQPEMA